MSNYFEIPAISSSLLKKARTYFQNNRSMTGFKLPKEKQTEALAFGSLVHEAIETNGASLKKYIVIPTELTEGVSANELKVLSATDPSAIYFELYNNVDTREVIAAKEQFGNEVARWSMRAIKADTKINSTISSLFEKNRLLVNYINNKKAVAGNDYIIMSSKSFEADLDVVSTAMENVKHHIFKNTTRRGYTHYGNEVQVLAQLDGANVKIMMDRVDINNTTKNIKITDYKTSIDSASQYHYNFCKYGYDLQASFYCYVVRNCSTFANLIKQGYTISFEFIYINSNTGAIKPIVSDRNDLELCRIGGYLLPVPMYNFTDGIIKRFHGIEPWKAVSMTEQIGMYNGQYEVKGWNWLLKEVSSLNLFN